MTDPTAAEVTDLTRKAETLAALRDPQVGDRFHDMYSWWMYVVAVDGDTVTTLAANPPCTFPADGKRKVWTRADFVRGNCYSTTADIPFLMLADRCNNVTGWAEQ